MTFAPFNNVIGHIMKKMCFLDTIKILNRYILEKKAKLKKNIYSITKGIIHWPYCVKKEMPTYVNLSTLNDT